MNKTETNKSYQKGRKMINRENAIDHLNKNKHQGWITLVEIIYDNLPQDIIITEVFQKWAGLEIRFDGENEEFSYLVENVRYISKKICEVCGKSGSYSIIDGWETTLCETHHNSSVGEK